MSNAVNISQIVGKGYKKFWESKKLYRVLMGGRGSKKSVTTSIYYIYNMMKYYHEYGVLPNLLVIRKYHNTHKDSTRAQLEWAINKLGVAHLWNMPKSELTLTYKPSGQQVLFRGLDDPQSITSIVAKTGTLCWFWVEEAFQCNSEADFNKIEMSLRGTVPEPLFKQITLTANPWSDKHWIKARFFDKDDPDVDTFVTNYFCNEFLDESDIRRFERMKEENPRRYSVEGLGNWGISEGLVYKNWEEVDFDIHELLLDPDYRSYNGIDWGYNDPFAFVASKNKKDENIIYVYDEIYRSEFSNQDIANALKRKGFARSKILSDSGEIRVRKELELLGILGLQPVKKQPIVVGIQKLQDYKIVVHPRCVNTIAELNSYAWSIDKHTGKPTDVPVDYDNHLMDALRYATRDLGRLGWQFA